MSMTMTAAPAAEPVTLAEAKAQLRVDGDHDDSFISSLIITSRLQIEAALGLALVTQSWRLILDAWPLGPAIEMPMRPVQSVSAVSALTLGEPEVTLAPTMYILDGNASPARIILTAAPSTLDLAARGLAIDFTAGFGDAAAVPQNIKQALLLLVTHWYEKREPRDDGSITAIPEAVSTLLSPYRVVRL